MLSGCSTSLKAISGTPTADDVLSNARQVARELDSYRAVKTTVTTTVYPNRSRLNHSESRNQSIEVGSYSEYRVDSPDFDHEYILIGETSYSRSDDGEWESRQVSVNEFDLLPGEDSLLPPSHPAEWLDRRYVKNTQYEGEESFGGGSVYVISGEIPMLPGPVDSELGLPTDYVRILIDKETFNVVRIEIDQNVLDSLREDSGYQVILGVVEIDTREIIEYSAHNERIEIMSPLENF